ncbi:MAG: nodulation protein NfeD [Chloroflexi bacterium]|nr:nodulation protein NfeD [Chloroflexota bacterium]
MKPPLPPRRRSPRLALLQVLLVLALVASACGGGPGGPPGAVYVLDADGTVNPIMARFLERAIENAEHRQAGAVVIELDTPGGLSTSMDDIVKRILSAKVPVIVYVWPPGGHAASAGTFIVMASHVAAMAPGTSIGAATPVAAGGEDIKGTLADKATNDAAARIRDIAELRGRNAAWAEKAVRRAASASSAQALKLGVVDFVAPDLPALLREVDGLQVTLQDGREVTLGTAGAPLVRQSPNLIEELLNIIGDPNIALLLISLGTIALFFELINPGAIFPGVFGVISLILGFFALSVIPFNWAGVALIVLAFILFFLELFITSHGILGLGGVISLVFGGLLLTSGNPAFAGADPEVNRWLLYGLAIGVGVYVLFVLTSILRIRGQPAAVGVETMMGRQAIARSALDPEGFIFADGEYWSAEAEEPVQPGEHVVITGIKGLRLKVKRQSERRKPDVDS